MTANPMQGPLAMHQSPRCTAHSKRTGKPCGSPAVRGWAVCRMHGARGGCAKGQAQRCLPAWWLHAGGFGRVAVCQGDGEAVEADTGRDFIDANSTLRLSVSVASLTAPSRQGPWRTGERRLGGGWRQARSTKSRLVRQKWKLQAQKNAQRLLTASMP